MLRQNRENAFSMGIIFVENKRGEYPSLGIIAYCLRICDF